MRVYRAVLIGGAAGVVFVSVLGATPLRVMSMANVHICVRDAENDPLWNPARVMRAPAKAFVPELSFAHQDSSYENVTEYPGTPPAWQRDFTWKNSFVDAAYAGGGMGFYRWGDRFAGGLRALVRYYDGPFNLTENRYRGKWAYQTDPVSGQNVLVYWSTCAYIDRTEEAARTMSPLLHAMAAGRLWGVLDAGVGMRLEPGTSYVNETRRTTEDFEFNAPEPRFMESTWREEGTGASGTFDTGACMSLGDWTADLALSWRWYRGMSRQVTLAADGEDIWLDDRDAFPVYRQTSADAVAEILVNRRMDDHLLVGGYLTYNPTSDVWDEERSTWTARPWERGDYGWSCGVGVGVEKWRGLTAGIDLIYGEHRVANQWFTGAVPVLAVTSRGDARTNYFRIIVGAEQYVWRDALALRVGMVKAINPVSETRSVASGGGPSGLTAQTQNYYFAGSITLGAAYRAGERVLVEYGLVYTDGPQVVTTRIYSPGRDYAGTDLAQQVSVRFVF
jgi:hypothetical protein